MLFKLLLALHVITCVTLIIVVLMQSSKGGGLAGAFGGGGDQTIFGGHETATFLSKATTYLAVTFMVLSLTLAFLASKRNIGQRESALRGAARQPSDVIPKGETIEELMGATGIDTVSAENP